MKPPVLFLDVDGVLNRCGLSGQGLESDKVALLKEILDTTHCRVVLSSTWRKTEHQLLRIHKMLGDIGHVLTGTTPVIEETSSGSYGSPVWIAATRDQEISAWLQSVPVADRPSHFVILDDVDMGELSPFLVRTDSHTGLTAKHASEVISRLRTANVLSTKSLS